MGFRAIVKTIPKTAPQKCASCPILSVPFFAMYQEYQRYPIPKTKEGILMPGIKMMPMPPKGLITILENTIAETAPEAPTAL